MKRRTFLTGTLLGAAGLTAVPAGASAASVTVSSLDGLQKAIDRAVPGDRIVVADGVYTVPPRAAPCEDIDGHPRGSARDVGADQYTTLAPVPRPLTAADVGPNAS
ncbi:hypothetical protein [Streptomyces sp. NPDC053079]|uniref:hypothetical protein n=1 Tax=Streptomyces sp. NPDC053079 TaxID=3365697 RepID=UPI0037D3D8E6